MFFNVKWIKEKKSYVFSICNKNKIESTMFKNDLFFKMHGANNMKSAKTWIFFKVKSIDQEKKKFVVSML